LQKSAKITLQKSAKRKNTGQAQNKSEHHQKVL
jgi:hypothetical protein